MKVQPDQETEIKLYVLDLDKIERRILESGGRLIQSRTFETNLRFDLPDGSLRREGRVLRLRRDQDSYLTYKGPSAITDGVLSRVEYECTVGDFEMARKTIEALGYQLIAVYEKYRSIFALDDSLIMLDELPYGPFVEIEGADKDGIRRITEKLGLNFDCAVPSSYLGLFEQLCQHEDLDPENLTFTALGKNIPSADDLGVEPADR